MYSYHNTSFNTGSDNDLVAEGIQNVWICQVGSENTDGSFAQFIDKLTKSKVTFITF